MKFEKKNGQLDMLRLTNVFREFLNIFVQLLKYTSYYNKYKILLFFLYFFLKQKQLFATFSVYLNSKYKAIGEIQKVS